MPSRRSRLLVLLLFLSSALLAPGAALASGPHWVAGVNYFNPAAKGQPLVWANGQVSYYLDQGALSGSVSNSQAAALVATAAAVWSAVPTAAVAITRGGSLSEDVNSSNVTANLPAGTGATLPADVQPSATSEPVGIIFDADGSVINAIYGADASDAGACTQNGVYVTVDNFAAGGTIAHALIIINGLCASSAALEGLLTYELVRAFGRVLGLDWSQVNEAMFTTGSETSEGLSGWPLMHPLERLCFGSSTSCLPNPTTLRLDDIAGLNQLYPVTQANLSAWTGKTLTASSTFTVSGTITFRDGQGMQGVNIELMPLNGSANGPVPDLRYTVSAVSGAYFRVNSVNAVLGTIDSHGNPTGEFGTDDTTKEGYFVLAGVPLPPGTTSASYQLLIEPVNSLYTGGMSVGPYVADQVAPSGAMQTAVLNSVSAGSVLVQNFTLSDSADGNQTDDGLEAQPDGLPANGEWMAKLVGYGHAGWFQFYAQANRTFTVEAASVDEAGLGTESKAAVVIGVWNGTDALGSLPALASTVPFDGAMVGLATLNVQTSGSGEVRVAYADLRGDGRPDFTYRARVLYADRVWPARLTLAGGTIAIFGQGFRPGVAVLINGVAAAVTSVTPTEITAVAPSVSAPTGTVPLLVRDPQTLGTTEILDGLSYDVQGTDGIRILSAPSGTISQGVPVPLVVQAVGGDAVTPARNVSVTFALRAGQATMACSASPCTAMTDNDGVATMMVTPASASSTEVTASLTNGASVTAVFNGGTPPQIAATNALYLASGAQVSWTPAALVLSAGKPVEGEQVLWTGAVGAQVATASSTSNAAGIASTTVTAGPLATNATANVYACEISSLVCATFTVYAVHPEAAGLVPVSGIGQALAASATPMPVSIEVVDGVGHAMAGAQVNLYQQMYAWQPPCPAQGRCPAPQQLGASSATLTSDANGMVTATSMSNDGQPVTIKMLATSGDSGTLSWNVVQRP